ncbi:uncharacterized protein RAG0_16299 [Rhynchosporium agropyri]|uniref:Uncharacterized protein n=1 Tax=Rhynchosporium agropyri TaxID=914238 RepID=A0A1E1LPR6_9HELO|nr:uncharacterized protein RAG0_16299 [Rhynchosporium agropyri]
MKVLTATALATLFASMVVAGLTHGFKRRERLSHVTPSPRPTLRRRKEP